MEISASLVLEAAVALLQQFVAPDEDVVQAVCQKTGLAPPEDLDEWHIILTRALRPQDSDYALIFRGDAATQAHKGYTELWEKNPGLAITPKRDQTYLQAVVTQASMIATDPDAIDQFPGGYKDILHHLQPEVYWIAWEFRSPSERFGSQWNGLIYVNQRFLFCPKPWRVLEES